MSQMHDMCKHDENAIPFIYFQEGKFQINEQALKFLKDLSPDNYIAVASIVGKYRTGKSYFINQTLLKDILQERKVVGFEVGSTVNAVTKGIWIYKKTIIKEMNNSKRMEILVLDTEGCDGTEKEQNYDQKLILITLLISSYFIYNTIGVIDENTIGNLTLLVEFAKQIQQQFDNNNQLGNSFNIFPFLLWVVRDFSLKLTDTGGNNISEKEYLEKALQIQHGISDKIESKNRIRRMLNHFFPQRDCVVLVRPTDTEQQLHNLNRLEHTNIRQEFLKQLSNVYQYFQPKLYLNFKARNKIFQQIQPFQLQKGQYLNGRMFSELCTDYVKYINQDILPKLKTTWEYIINQEFERCITSIYKDIDEQIELIILQLKTKRIQNKEIKEKLNNQQRLSIDYLNKNIADIENKNKCIKEIAEYLQNKYLLLKQMNINCWNIYYEEQINIDQKILEIKGQCREHHFLNFPEVNENILQKMKEKIQQILIGGPHKQSYIFKFMEQFYQVAIQRMEQNLKNKYIKLNEEGQSSFEQQINKNKAELAQLQNQNIEKDKNIQSILINQRELQTTLDKKIDEMERIQEQNNMLKVTNEGKSVKINELNQKICSLLEEKQQSLEISYQQKIEVQPNQQQQQEISSKQKEDITFESNWLTEKKFLENQINLLSEQLENNKQLNNLLSQKVSQNNSSLLQSQQMDQAKQKIDYLRTENHLIQANLVQLCAQREKYQENLEQKQKQLQLEDNYICNHCEQQFSKSNQKQFVLHLQNQNCKFNINQQRDEHFSKSPIQINTVTETGPSSNRSQLQYSQRNQQINQIYQFEASANTKSNYENNYAINDETFLINLQARGINWTIQKSYSQFIIFHQKLIEELHNMNFHFDPAILFMNLDKITGYFKENVMHQEGLKMYLNDISHVHIIRDTKTYRDFIELDTHTMKNDQLINENYNSGYQTSKFGTQRISLLNEEQANFHQPQPLKEQSQNKHQQNNSQSSFNYQIDSFQQNSFNNQTYSNSNIKKYTDQVSSQTNKYLLSASPNYIQSKAQLLIDSSQQKNKIQNMENNKELFNLNLNQNLQSLNLI